MGRVVAVHFQALWALCLLIGAQCLTVKQNAVLLTRNKALYEGNFNYTIENFLELPFPESNEGYFFDSSLFPAADEVSGFKWFFRIYPRYLRNGQKGLDVDLRLASVPSNATSPIVTFQCAIIDFKGNLRYTKRAPEKKLTLTSGSYINPFISRDTLVSKANELLPHGHLTLQCGVRGYIKNKSVNYAQMITSEEQSHRTLSLPSSECGRNLASANMQTLSQKNFDLSPNVVLEASGKRFKRHKEILGAQSPVLSSTFATHDNDLAAVINFDKDMNALELEDMLNFQYQGTASNLETTCHALYVVAKKYQFDCLMTTCEDVLIGQITAETVLDLLKYGVKHGAVRLTESAGNYVSKNPDKCSVNEN